MKKAVLLLLIVVCFASCAEKAPIETTVTSLDIIDAQPIDFADIVEEVTCIPLDYSPESFFSDCWKIRCYQEYIYLYSLSDFAVYIFNTQGHFVKKIDASGKLATPSDIYINERRQELWVLDYRNYLNRYTLTGELIEHQELPFAAVTMEHYSHKEFLFYDGYFDRENSSLLFLSDVATAKNKKGLIAKSEKNIPPVIPATLFTRDTETDAIYMLLKLNDTIYISEPKSKTLMRPLYHLETKGTMLTEDSYPADGFTDREYAEFRKSNQHIVSVNSFYFASGKLFFKLEGKYAYYVMIDTRTNQVSKFGRLFDGLHTHTPATSIQGTTGNELLFLFNTSHLLAHYALHNTTSIYPSINQTLDELTQSNQTDGYVIIRAKIKE